MASLTSIKIRQLNASHRIAATLGVPTPRRKQNADYPDARQFMELLEAVADAVDPDHAVPIEPYVINGYVALPPDEMAEAAPVEPEPEIADTMDDDEAPTVDDDGGGDALPAIGKVWE